MERLNMALDKFLKGIKRLNMPLEKFKRDLNV